MLVVQPPDLILDRNASARTLLNGTMVLPPELSAVAARLAALPPETPETVEWGPPGQPPSAGRRDCSPLPTDAACSPWSAKDVRAVRASGSLRLRTAPPASILFPCGDSRR